LWRCNSWTDRSQVGGKVYRFHWDGQAAAAGSVRLAIS
jgi:hypothetical protein